MKTISGKTISSKPVSLSKAAKVLSKFVSAENGASRAVSAYLHQTSAAFSELNQLHKELKSSRSGQKRKKHGSETYYGSETVAENPIQTIDIIEELNHAAMQSKNKFKGYQFGSEHVAEGVEKQIDNAVCHEFNDAVGYHPGNEGSGEKHKKKRRKQQIESREHRDNRFEFEEKENDGKLPAKTPNMDEGKATQSVEFSQEPNGAVGVGGTEKHKKKKKKQETELREHRDRFEIEEKENDGKLPTKTQNMDEGKPNQSVEFSQEPNDAFGVGVIEKHKKKKKRQEVDSTDFGDNGVQIEERGDESKLTTKAQVIFAQSVDGDNLGMEGAEKHKRDKNKHRSDRIENGGSVDPQELQSKKKRIHEGGREDKINTELVKREQRKKRKNEFVEERLED